MKTVLVPIEVSDEIFDSLFTTRNPQTVTPPATQAPSTRVVSQTIEDIYVSKSNQLTVAYHMTYGSEQQYEYWVPKEDETFIANSGLEVGKSYDITMEKTFSKNGKPRYRWTHIEPR